MKFLRTRHTVYPRTRNTVARAHSCKLSKARLSANLPRSFQAIRTPSKKTEPQYAEREREKHLVIQPHLISSSRKRTAMDNSQAQALGPRDRRTDALGDLQVLPDETLCALLEYLTPRDLARLACVSRFKPVL